MRIRFDLLRSHGYRIDYDEDEGKLDIFPEKSNHHEFEAMVERLHQGFNGLSRADCEQMVGEMLSQAHGRNIMRICAGDQGM